MFIALLIVSLSLPWSALAQSFINRDNPIDRASQIRNAEEANRAVNARIQAENALRDSQVRNQQEISRLKAEVAKLQSQIKSEEIKEKIRQERLNFQRNQLNKIAEGLERSKQLQEQIIQLAELEYRLGMGRWDTYSIMQLKRQAVNIDLNIDLNQERNSFLDSVQ